ncbi:MAG: CPC_1213 family protein [Solirubrobacterales bacterium]
MDSKMKNTKEKDKEDGKFKKKNINHSPQAESSRVLKERGDINES